MSYLVPLVGFMVVALIVLAAALWRLGSKREESFNLTLPACSVACRPAGSESSGSTFVKSEGTSARSGA